MREHFDASATAMPFLLRFQEPGPEPIVIDGRYDGPAQRWVHTDTAPRNATSRSTSRSTSRPTTRSTVRPTTRSTFRFNSSDVDGDTTSDSDFDSSPDTDFDTTWD